MNIKKSLKLSVTLEYILTFLMVSCGILSIGFLINFILSFFEVIVFSSSTLFFPLIFPSFLILYFNVIAVWLIEKIVLSSNNKINQYLKTTREEKIVLIRLFSKQNHPSKLNLELQKISKAVENKSSLYHDLGKSDFPYLNKLFRRLNSLQGTLKDEDSHIENISSNDLNKLNIHNPMLLTFEKVDNELNNLISQNILNQNTKCVKTIEG